MKHRLLAAAACAATAVVAAGCGGSTPKSGGLGESGASMVTSGALAYVAIDSDLGSSQWQKLDSLLKKFPIRDRLLAKLKDELAKKQLDYERDVKPALGPETDLAVEAGSSVQDIAYAYLWKPDSMEKAKALVQKLDQSSPSATRIVDGWLVVSDKEEMIDRVLKGSGSSLADDGKFKEAMGKLPDDALVKAYANGRQISDLVDSIFGGTAQTTALGGGSSQFGLDKLDWLAAALAAKDDGIGLEGDIKGTNGTPFALQQYESKLISGVPADAIAFISFHGKPGFDPLSQARRNPAFSEGLRQIEQMLGMSLDHVFALFEHETVFYVRRGPGIPEFSLVLETPDTQQALTTIDGLASRVAAFTHGRLGSEKEDGLDVKTLTYGPVTLHWAGFDGRVLLTTAPTGISDYRASGDKLGDSSSFKDALDAAGAPDKNGGLVYVNLADAVQLIQNYAGIANGKLPADVRENLKPLRSLVAYGTSGDDVTKLGAFLAVK
jgi:Protein of unknown function (DUF3352)